MNTHTPLSGNGLLKALPGLILLAGLALTWRLASQAERRDRHSAAIEFQLRADEIAASLQQRLLAHTQILHGLAGLFASAGDPGRDGFHAYVEALGLPSRYPGIQAIGYTAFVAAADADRHVAALRHQGLSDYAIRPAGQREAYALVSYIEPLDPRNQRVLGFDSLTETVRATAMRQAADTGQPAITGRVELLQENGQDVQSGILTFVPVYRNGVPLDTVDQRRNALLGWTYAALRMGDLMTRFLDEQYSELALQIGLRIVSEDPLTHGAILYGALPQAELSESGAYLARRELAVQRSRWSLDFQPLPEYWASHPFHERGRLFLGVGAAMSLLLAALLQALVKNHAQTVRTLLETRASHRDLAEQKNLLQAIYDHAHVGILLVTPSGRITHANHRLAELFRYPVAELVGRDYFTLVAAADTANARQRFGQLVSQETQSVSYERRYRRADQSEFWGYLSGSAFRDADGHILGLVGVIDDITARKAAEDRLKQLNAELESRIARRTAELGALTESLRAANTEQQAIFDAAKIGIMLTDHRVIRRCNRTLERMFGYDPDELLGHPTAILYGSAAAFAEVGEMGTASLLEKGYFNVEREVVRKDGSRFWVHLMAQPIDQNDLCRLAGTVEDITERKRNETQLRDSEERFRKLFQYLPIAYQSLDIEGRWLDANQKLADLLGFERPEDLLGLNFGDFWVDETREQFPDTFAQLQRDLHLRGELHLRRRDGQPITVELAGQAQRTPEGQFVRTHCVLVDVTERRRLEQTIREINANLEEKVAERTAQLAQANQAKSEFLANMSHEIRTPMNAILGIAQILERETLTPDQRSLLQKISDSGSGLLHIINDILDLSKIEAGQLKLERNPLDLARTLSLLDALMTPGAQDKGLELRFQPSVKLPEHLYGDPLRIKQVLLNLISNAIKFTEQGAVTVRVIPLEVSQTAARLRFEVTDTGIGINDEALTRIFEPFTQADASTTRQYGGTGLGLSISKRLVELMGGMIGATSTPDAGSIFWFELPLERVTAPCPPKALIAAPATPAPRPGPRLTGLRVLAVDDNRTNLFMLERALRLEGVAVIALAADGQLALQTLRANPRGFDVVLMDIQMPVMDGLTATRAIRADADPVIAGLPVIALTAGVMAEERESTLAAGVNEFLAKPLDLETMVATLRPYAPAQTAPPPPAAASSAPPAPPSGDDGFLRIAGLDTERVAALLGHDRAYFLRMLSLFLETFGNLVPQLQTDLAAGDRDAAICRVHNLKGNAGNLGAMALMQTAQRLESALREGSPDLPLRLEQATAQLAALADASAPSLTPEPAASTAPPLDPAALAELRAALGDHNLAALKLHASLEPAIAGVYGPAATAALAKAMRYLRFEEALVLLERGGD